MSKGPYKQAGNGVFFPNSSPPRACCVCDDDAFQVVCELNRLHARAVAAERVVEAAREYVGLDGSSAPVLDDTYRDLRDALDATEGTNQQGGHP